MTANVTICHRIIWPPLKFIYYVKIYPRGRECHRLTSCHLLLLPPLSNKAFLEIQDIRTKKCLISGSKYYSSLKHLLTLQSSQLAMILQPLT